MDKIKKGLGRGLSSLIGETKVEPQKNQVSISDLVPNKYQPRKIFDEASLEDLTNSIKERGMIQPIIVRKSAENVSKFEIIAGDVSWELNVYDNICDAMAQAAEELEVPIKWGAAWSEGDIRYYDDTAEDAMNAYIDLRRSQGRRPFIDAPHFEKM